MINGKQKLHSYDISNIIRFVLYPFMFVLVDLRIVCVRVHKCWPRNFLRIAFSSEPFTNITQPNPPPKRLHRLNDGRDGCAMADAKTSLAAFVRGISMCSDSVRKSMKNYEQLNAHNVYGMAASKHAYVPGGHTKDTTSRHLADG